MNERVPTTIFATQNIPATDIYQNHMDKLHSLFNQFCLANKTYDWTLLISKKKISGITAIENYLLKNEPKSISYVISRAGSSEELLVKIDNGISLNIKNGSHSLYGLYSLVLDSTSLVTMPHFIVVLRRYWLFSLFTSILFIPAILFSMAHLNVLSIIWMIVMLSGAAIGYYVYFYTYIPQYVDSGYDRMMKKAEWEKIILSTNVRYNVYSSNLGSPVYSFLKSTKTLVSVAASIATILSFVLFVK